MEKEKGGGSSNKVVLDLGQCSFGYYSIDNIDCDNSIESTVFNKIDSKHNIESYDSNNSIDSTVFIQRLLFKSHASCFAF